MNKMELVADLEGKANYHDTVHVVCINVDTGATYEVKGVQYEVHEDADGSATLWLKIEEN